MNWHPVRSPWGPVVAACLSLAAFGQVHANTTLSDFSNFALTGTYVVWDGSTFTPTATNFRVQAPGDFGGSFKNLVPAINATGETTLELKLDVNPNNVANKFNVVLIDGDGTERVYRFANVLAGAGQTLTTSLATFLQDNQPGTTPGLNISNLTVFHLQGTFENGNPGQAMDLTFDNLALTGAVPEPATLAIAGMASILGIVFCGRRR